MIQEELSGKGVLRGGDHSASLEWQVDYRFVITSNIITRHGFPPVEGKRDSIGSISALDGQHIPEGYYQLTAQDGETLRVKNLGLGQWCILASF